MGFFRGILRISIMLGTFIVFTPTAIILSFLPFITYRKTPIAAWATTWVARFALFVFGIKVICEDREKISQHKGLIFPNHLSYLDIVIMMAFTPVRFLAKEAIAKWIFIGQMAKAIGCIFVNREDKDSRQAAREMLEHIEMPPPLVIYPEGRTGPGKKLLPFRYGAFDIAVQSGRSFLPCPIVYEREEIANWSGDESFLVAVWRMTSRAGTLHVTVTPLDVVQTQPTDDAKILAETARTQMLALLPYEEK